MPRPPPPPSHSPPSSTPSASSSFLFSSSRSSSIHSPAAAPAASSTPHCQPLSRPNPTRSSLHTSSRDSRPGSASSSLTFSPANCHLISSSSSAGPCHTNSSSCTISSAPCCCSAHVWLNIAVLGHIDCGKTALVRALTEVKSTAALDKPPQSRQRGMTLDLGFTAFHLPLNRPVPSTSTIGKALLPGKHDGEVTTAVQEAGRPDTEETKKRGSPDLQTVTAHPSKTDVLHPQQHSRCAYTTRVASTSCTEASFGSPGAALGTAPQYSDVKVAVSPSFEAPLGSSSTCSSSSSSASPSDSPCCTSSSASSSSPTFSSISACTAPSVCASSSSSSPHHSLSSSSSPSVEVFVRRRSPLNSSARAEASCPHAHYFPPSSAQVCLVDCPGHASLLRTIIGGVHIVHGVLLVIDATKGIQAQTAECIVVAELLTCELIVVLNKIDLIPPETREEKLAIVTRKLRETFSQTSFGRGVHIVAVSANPSTVFAAGAEQEEAACKTGPWGLEEVKRALSAMLLRNQSVPGGCSGCYFNPAAVDVAVSPTLMKNHGQNQGDEDVSKIKQESTRLEVAKDMRGTNLAANRGYWGMEAGGTERAEMDTEKREEGTDDGQLKEFEVKAEEEKTEEKNKDTHLNTRSASSSCSQDMQSLPLEAAPEQQDAAGMDDRQFAQEVRDRQRDRLPQAHFAFRDGKEEGLEERHRVQYKSRERGEREMEGPHYARCTFSDREERKLKEPHGIHCISINRHETGLERLRGNRYTSNNRGEDLREPRHSARYTCKDSEKRELKNPHGAYCTSRDSKLEGIEDHDSGKISGREDTAYSDRALDTCFCGTQRRENIYHMRIKQPEPQPQQRAQQQSHLFVDCLWNTQRCAACSCCKQRRNRCYGDNEAAPHNDTTPCSSNHRSFRSDRYTAIKEDTSSKGLRSNTHQAGERGPFYMAYDHCFALKGTVLEGHTCIGDQLAVLPACNTGSSSSSVSDNSTSGRRGTSRHGSSSRSGSSSSTTKGGGSSRSGSGVIVGKVRSLQTFHKDVKMAVRGQRVAVGLVGIDATSLERGALCDVGHIPKRAIGCCAVVKKIRFLKSEPQNKPSSLYRSSPSSSTPSTGTLSSFSPTCSCPSSTLSSSSSSLSLSSSLRVPLSAAAAAASLERFNACSPSTVLTSLGIGRIVPVSRRNTFSLPAVSPSTTSASTSPSEAALLSCGERQWPETLDEDAVYRCLDRLEDQGGIQQLIRRASVNRSNVRTSKKKKDAYSKQASSGTESSMHGTTCEDDQSRRGSPNKTVAGVDFTHSSSPVTTRKEAVPREIKDQDEDESPLMHIAVLLFEKAVIVPTGCLFICSKLDMEPSAAACRLAFFGRVLLTLEARDAAAAASCQLSQSFSSYRNSSFSLSRTIPKSLWLHPALQRLKLLRRKKKLGLVERFLFSPPCNCLPVEPYASNCSVSLAAYPHAPPASPSVPTSASSAHSSVGSDIECLSHALIGTSLFKSSQHATAFAGFRVFVLPPVCLQDAAGSAYNVPGGAAAGTPDLADDSITAAEHPAFTAQSTAALTGNASETEEGKKQQQRNTDDTLHNKASAYIRSEGLLGWIEKPFGNKGKFVVRLSEPVSCTAVRCILPRDVALRTQKGGRLDSRFRILLEYEKRLVSGTNRFSQQCPRLCGT